MSSPLKRLVKRCVAFANAFVVTLRAAPKVVFIGDSLTSGWNLIRWFPGANYVNKGIGSNTTAQMLARFDTDVLSERPHAVLIWGGTNDLGAATSVESVCRNITQMRRLAIAAGIVPILGAVTPRRGSLADANPAIVVLNNWIRQSGSVVADFYSVTVSESGELRSDLAVDGVHFSPDGYRVLTPVATSAIARGLAEAGARSSD